MLSESVFYDTTHLLVNRLTLIDQLFYSFVQERLEDCQSDLLEIRQISSVPYFLLTDDPCQVLNLDIADNEVKTTEETDMLSTVRWLIRGEAASERRVEMLTRCIGKEDRNESKTSTLLRSTIATFPFNRSLVVTLIVLDTKISSQYIIGSDNSLTDIGSTVNRSSAGTMYHYGICDGSRRILFKSSRTVLL